MSKMFRKTLLDRRCLNEPIIFGYSWVATPGFLPLYRLFSLMSDSSLKQQSTTLMTPKKAESGVLSEKSKETMVGFVLGGLAACGAVTFTNPWEV
jgi:hypothetical protein